jgi:hypothetical protein
MIAKELRKYDLIIEIGNVSGVENLRELAANNFAAAVDMWEYKMTKDINAFGAFDVFGMLESVSETKLRGAIADNAALLKLLYGVSGQSCTGANLGYLAGLIIGSKIDAAEEILKLFKSNQTGDYGKRMNAVVDSVFGMSMAKTGSKKATLNHKQTILLFDYVSKMKSGTIKSLLTQRLKEL